MAEAAFPAVIKHYRLEQQLGRGAMGLVVKGIDRRDESPVAIKLLHPHLAAGDATFRERFEREAHVAALLHSPYTVQLFDYGLADGFYYIVMEFVEGSNLGARIHNGPLEVDDALRIAGEVAHALEEAGARGIVHRDIKPENILIDPAGRVKVTDFGIARRAASSDITTAGTYLGTAAYAAPEQMGGTADHRSDIYSLGATLYCMLAGNPPFRGRTMFEVVQQHQTSPVPMAALVGVPEAALNIIRRCMEKDPLDRYQSASDLAGAIERARRTARGASPATPRNAPSPPPAAPTPAPMAAPPAPQAATPPAQAPAPVPRPAAAPVRQQPPPTPYQTGVQPTVSRESGRIIIRQGPAPVPPARPPASQRPPQTPSTPLAQAQPEPKTGGPSRTLWLRAGFGVVALLGAGGIIYGILNASGGNGGGKATPTPTAQATTATASASATTAVTASATAVTATPLASVTSTLAISQLGSGVKAKVQNSQNCTAVPVWAQPTSATDGAYASNKVLKQLCDGDTVVVVTNTPAASTTVVTEGFIWWRVLVEKTGEVGWVKEIRADGVAPRYLAR